jgi:hypothetical protein
VEPDDLATCAGPARASEEAVLCAAELEQDAGLGGRDRRPTDMYLGRDNRRAQRRVGVNNLGGSTNPQETRNLMCCPCNCGVVECKKAMIEYLFPSKASE